MTRFSSMVKDGMRRGALTLRELCRRAEVDPSYLSKVLSGKRPPPTEEKALKRLARVLRLDPAGLTVAAGRIPTEWDRLSEDAGLFEAVKRMVAGSRPDAASAPSRARGAWARVQRRDAPVRTSGWLVKKTPGRAKPQEPFAEELL